MADESTASTVVLVGAIIQILDLIGLIALTGLMAMLTGLLPLLDPSTYYPLTLAEMTFGAIAISASMGVLSIIALVFTILWFMWRRSPSQKKTGLIITGIFGIIIFPLGVLPGLLVLIGGAIAPSESELRAEPIPAASKGKPVTPDEGVKYCASCGNPAANPNAEFCGVCGASMK